MTAADRVAPEIGARVAELAGQLDSGIVAIDGPSGAGKSTVADLLVAQLRERGAGVTLVRTDDFASWDDPVAWWPEVEADVLHSFVRRWDYRYRPRVWRDGVATPGPPVWIEWQPLLIIEGVSSARRRIADRLTHALWLDGGTEAERLERAVARDGEGSRAHLQQWQEFERGWFAVDRTRERCVVLD
ncbi:uridine kinase family protein [Gordonia alkanivorans]|uniref:uridine kinase family protein n=1 Tax=Gordonia alkanivorans TaxID=84096 RepID=UPI00244A8FE2|nr:(d)CMP kinase [Gordonia alkanivorans]MDH3007031.1 (d)CMP kinase [Gordonia alkanivorans]MDH3015092.1 (d)CMP kinase [Gordonia alkanivorans]MDH3040098.1 (d)CMP kinase [Gordonia alkanivorans]MDH3060364.1 (d)CMP kinase [Gordonia alkanivorans]